MYDLQGRQLSSARGRRPIPPTSASAAASGSERSLPLRTDAYPDLPDLEGLEPTFRLSPGQLRPVWVHVRRGPGGAADTRVVVRAISRDDFVRLDLAATLPWRPAVDLAAQGGVDTWQQSERGLTLYPFPNRVTPYTFSLTNVSAEERQVDVQILRAGSSRPAPSPPVGEVSAQEAEAYLTQIGPVEIVAAAEQVTVPPGSRPVPIPFGQLAKQAGGQEPEPAQGDSQDQPPPKTDQPAPVLNQLLLAVIVDHATDQRAIRTIEILTQRPARYVTARVQYDPGQRRAAIVVRALNPAALPPDGVSIECEQADGQGPVRPQALLQPPATETRLSLEVVPSGSAVVPLVLHVDGYQRAFQFALPVDASSGVDVAPGDDAAVRILAPDANTAFGPEPEPITAALQVDVSDELLQNTEQLLEIGLDANRDRRLSGDQTLLLSSDRGVDLTLAQVDRQGTFAVQTAVSDLEITLPAPKLRAARANLLARLRLPGGDVWSEPVELVFDDQPPRISGLALEPGSSVVQGETLGVSCLASDLDLSGVAKVEAGFDLARRGEAPDKPVAGTIQSDGRWLVQLPAGPDPGVYNVMVRAIDRQGNASDYQKLPVQIVSPEQAATIKEQGRRVTGTVVYGRFGKEPQPGVAVQLADAAGTSGRQTVTDDQGVFVFDNVSPGDYRVVAEATVRGNPRTGQAEIKVPPKPAAVESIELLLNVGR
jgi:hypothetical protein